MIMGLCKVLTIFILVASIGLATHTSYTEINPLNTTSVNESILVNFTINNNANSTDNITFFNISAPSNILFNDINDYDGPLSCISSNSTSIVYCNITNSSHVGPNMSTWIEMNLSATSDGNNQFYIVTEDDQSDSDVSNVSFMVDSTPPDTVIDTSPDFWYNTPVNATLNSTDLLSGVKNIKYCNILNNTCTPNETVNDDIAYVYVSDDGINFVFFHAKDYLENKETTKNSTIKIDTIPPANVTGLTNTSIGNSFVNLAWNASNDSGSGLSNYLVFRDGTNIYNTSENVTNETDYYDSNLEPDTSYSYFVLAMDHANNFANSSLLEITTLSDTTPPNVTLNSPNNNAWVTSLNVTFSFTPSDDSGLANCTLWTNESGSWSPEETNTDITNNEINSINHTFADQRNHTIWNVQCVDLNGNEANATNNYTVRVDIYPPTQVSNLQGVPTGKESIELSWSTASDDMSGVEKYQIYKSGQPTGAPQNSPWEDILLSCGTTYDYSVSAKDYAGWYGGNSSVSVTTSQCDQQQQQPPSQPPSQSPEDLVILFVNITSLEDGASFDFGEEVTITMSISYMLDFCEFTLDNALYKNISGLFLVPPTYSEVLTNLSSGSHTFSARCRGGLGIVTDEVSFSVNLAVVAPPTNETLNETGNETGIGAGGIAPEAPFAIGLLTLIGVSGAGIYVLKRQDKLPSKEEFKKEFRKVSAKIKRMMPKKPAVAEKVVTEEVPVAAKKVVTEKVPREKIKGELTQEVTEEIEEEQERLSYLRRKLKKLKEM